MTRRLMLLTVALGTFGSIPAATQEITLGGQIRPRYEFRDPVAGEADAFTSMRVRADLTASLERNVRVFVQLQDVRLWGEETNTLTDFQANGFDLHQGYVDLWHPVAGVRLSARVGRQEVNFGGERLVGAVGWTQQARSFDGVRLAAAGSFGTVELVGYKVAEGSDPGIALDAEFAGVYASLAGVPGGTLDVYGLYDRVASGTGTSRGTIGARYFGQGRFVYRVEGSYQVGKENLVDVGAFMFGARFGANLGASSVTLWYDYLSGDDSPGDGRTSAFNTLFATNHKFYGLADLFTSIPAHTGGFGLQDIALKAATSPVDPLTVTLDVHHFRAAKTGTLSSARFGEEIDLTGRYAYSRNVTATVGASYVIQGPALEDLGRLTQNLLWLYTMLDVRF
ncbi:MAG TPA: alginate export family protein [Gemmatimonadales bacterium]